MNFQKFRLAAATLLALVAGIAPCAAQDMKTLHAVDRLTVHDVSGVAVFNEGRKFAIVGNRTADRYFVYPDPGKGFPFQDNEILSVYDAESIDIEKNPNQELRVFLSEQHHKVFVVSKTRYGKIQHREIQLPSSFAEECERRGVEGISLRWSDMAWDLVVLWEGGYLHKNANGCTRERDSVENPRLIRYGSKDGLVWKMTSEVIELQTKKLLENVSKEVFRATDIAWYGDQYLVLLGSTPQREETNSFIDFKHTWLKVFGLDGKEADARQMKLENIFRETGWRHGNSKSKNWEGLDFGGDGSFILAYDTSESSEIVSINFEPKASPR